MDRGPRKARHRLARVHTRPGGHTLPRRPDHNRSQWSVRVERGGAKTKEEQGAQLQRQAAPVWEPVRLGGTQIGQA